MIVWILFIFHALAQPLTLHERYIRWVNAFPVTKSTEDNYLFYGEMHHKLKELVEDYSGRITPFRVGHTVKNRPIWGFKISDPTTEVKTQVLVFAGLHALEWIGTETTIATISELTLHPISYVEVIIIPLVNVDRRLVVESDLLKKDIKYRRANASNVDLNRDFEINRSSDAIWKHLFPSYYTASPGPLSQPESRAIDRLAAKENFEVAISLHSFGGYIFYPWAGSYDRPKDHAEFVRLGRIMQQALPGKFQYHLQQLSHWSFLFRTLGTEIDHLYGKYGIKAFLIELTRTGIDLSNPKTRKNPFRWYNPTQPKTDINRGKAAILAISRHLGQQHW